MVLHARNQNDDGDGSTMIEWTTRLRFDCGALLCAQKVGGARARANIRLELSSCALSIAEFRGKF